MEVGTAGVHVGRSAGVNRCLFGAVGWGISPTGALDSTFRGNNGDVDGGYM